MSTKLRLEIGRALGQGMSELGAGLALRHHEDLRTLCIVATFYTLQVARWRASDATVDRVDAAACGLGDEIWIAVRFRMPIWDLRFTEAFEAGAVIR